MYSGFAVCMLLFWINALLSFSLPATAQVLFGFAGIFGTLLFALIIFVIAIRDRLKNLGFLIAFVAILGSFFLIRNLPTRRINYSVYRWLYQDELSKAVTLVAHSESTGDDAHYQEQLTDALFNANLANGQNADGAILLQCSGWDWFTSYYIVHYPDGDAASLEALLWERLACIIDHVEHMEGPWYSFTQNCD